MTIRFNHPRDVTLHRQGIQRDGNDVIYRENKRGRIVRLINYYV